MDSTTLTLGQEERTEFIDTYVFCDKRTFRLQVQNFTFRMQVRFRFWENRILENKISTLKVENFKAWHIESYLKYYKISLKYWNVTCIRSILKYNRNYKQERKIKEKQSKNYVTEAYITNRVTRGGRRCLSLICPTYFSLLYSINKFSLISENMEFYDHTIFHSAQPES